MSCCARPGRLRQPGSRAVGGAGPRRAARGRVPSRAPAPAVWSSLSAQELQVARMAAEGLSNRQIGERLYLSHRTVASHLYHIFPKLGITSRAQLTAMSLDLPPYRLRGLSEMFHTMTGLSASSPRPSRCAGCCSYLSFWPRTPPLVSSPLVLAFPEVSFCFLQPASLPVAVSLPIPLALLSTYSFTYLLLSSTSLSFCMYLWLSLLLSLCFFLCSVGGDHLVHLPFTT